MVTVTCFYLLFLKVDWNSADQSAFVIDGFYYYKIGSEYNFNSFNDIIYNPINTTSAGVLFFNVLYAAILPIGLYPIVNVILFFLTIISFYSIRSSIPFGFVLLLLTPYLAVVSKEFIVAIGALLLFSRGQLIIRVVGFFLLSIGRPESGMIAIFSYFLLKAVNFKARYIFFICLACGVIAYIVFLRGAMYSVSLAFQEAATGGDYTCELPLLRTCLTDKSMFELTVFQRILALFFLPIKWLSDVVLVQSVFSFYYFFVGLFLFLFLFGSSYINSVIRERPALVGFCLMNIFCYIGILFIAPSRPVSFYLCLILIFSVLKSKEPSRGVDN